MNEKPRVFVTRRLPGGVEARIAPHTRLQVWPERGAPPRAELLAAVDDCEGLLCMLTDRIDAELLRSAPKLRALSSMSVGVDHIDLAAMRARGIPVGHTPGVLVDATADLCMALLLAAARRIPESDAFVREGRWQRWEPDLLLGRELRGSRLGILGLGAIGRAVAERARGFGMQVGGWTRSGRSTPGVEALGFEKLLGESDFVSVNVALTPETRGLLGARELQQMKRGAILVNTARGGIVDEDALCDALRSGHLAAAALDVFASEPLPGSSPLLALPREKLVVAPHIGSATLATRTRMAELAVENLLAGLAGRPLLHEAR
jgi:glyoxylate reductase